MSISAALSYEGAQVARLALATQRERGHIIAGMLPQGRPLGVRALCVQCGAELEVLWEIDLGRPRVLGRMRERACSPANWWATSDRDDRLAPLAFLARQDPAFMGHALAAYRRAQGTARDSLERLERLAQLLGITDGALHRLELYPFPSADPRESTPARARMTRDTRAHADRLSEVLDAARGALVAEGARALEAAREAEIAQAQAQLAAAEQAARRARAHLDGLLGLATTPAAGGR